MPSIEQPLEKISEDIPAAENEYDLDDFFHESSSFIIPLIEPKLIIPKKTRYMHLQNKCSDYCIMLFIHYLYFKEQWHNFCGKLHKKLYKIIRYFKYCL